MRCVSLQYFLGEIANYRVEELKRAVAAHGGEYVFFDLKKAKEEASCRVDPPEGAVVVDTTDDGDLTAIQRVYIDEQGNCLCDEMDRDGSFHRGRRPLYLEQKALEHIIRAIPETDRVNSVSDMKEFDSLVRRLVKAKIHLREL
jgi:hypothetical protein